MRMVRAKVRSHVMSFLGVACAGALGMVVWNCGGASTDDAAPETTADAPGDGSNSKKVDDPSQPQTLAIDTGALKGAGLEIPGDALPAGATFGLAEAKAPPAFGAATSGDNTPGSLALEVSFKDANGKAIDPTTPVTVSLPATTGALGLAAVDQVLANLYALLQTADSSLFFWSHDMFVSIDKATKVVKIQTLKGGVYQLAYLGTLPKDFSNANEKGVTPTKAAGAPAGYGVDLASVTCDGGTNRAAQFAENASFKAYLGAMEKCYCELAPQAKEAGFQCKAVIEGLFKGSVCQPPQQTVVVDDAGWTQTFDAATAQLRKYCDGTTFTMPTTGTDTGTPSGTDTNPTTNTPPALADMAPSCRNSVNGCYAYLGTGYDAQQLATAQAACEAAQGTWSNSGGCPKQDAVGVCKFSATQPTEFWQVYYSPQYTAETSQMSCDGGAWVVP
jgi:hypothetical protein